MTFRQHVTITTGILLLLSCFWKNYWGLLLIWLGGIFIDVDHYLDYVKETGDKRISLRRLEDYFYNLKEQKLYCIFHSYELMILLFIINFFYLKHHYLYGLLAGLAVHIILDAIFNPVKIQCYLFLYRLKHDFVFSEFLQQKAGIQFLPTSNELSED